MLHCIPFPANEECLQQILVLLTVGTCYVASACVLFFLSSPLYHHAFKIGNYELSMCNSWDFFLLRNLKLWNKKFELTQKITSGFYLVSFGDEAFVLIFKLRFILGST